VLSADHNLAWNNSPPYPVDLAAGDVLGDPLLELYGAEHSCEYLTYENSRDPLWPSWYGPARDAGSDRGIDLDGSRLDIGAFGGSLARYSPDWTDADGDGVPVLYDCEHFSASIAAGLPDAPYDGVDSDCRGDNDYDADDDGYLPAAYAAEGDAVDCDDTNALRNPGRPEVASNGLDDDCDGWADNVGQLEAARCSVGSGAPGWPMLGLLFLLWRRRASGRRAA
jgi:hypothetical protein